MDQFASNLNRMLDDQTSAPAATDAASEPETDASDEAAVPSGGNGSGDGAGTTSEPRPTVRKINGPAAEPVDLAGVAGPAVIKRVLPVVLTLLVVVLLLRRRRK